MYNIDEVSIEELEKDNLTQSQMLQDKTDEEFQAELNKIMFAGVQL